MGRRIVRMIFLRRLYYALFNFRCKNKKSQACYYQRLEIMTREVRRDLLCICPWIDRDKALPMIILTIPYV